MGANWRRATPPAKEVHCEQRMLFSMLFSSRPLYVRFDMECETSLSHSSLADLMRTSSC